VKRVTVIDRAWYRANKVDRNPPRPPATEPEAVPKVVPPPVKACRPRSKESPQRLAYRKMLKLRRRTKDFLVTVMSPGRPGDVPEGREAPMAAQAKAHLVPAEQKHPQWGRTVDLQGLA